MAEAVHHTFKTDSGSTRLEPRADRVRLTIGFPDGSVWVDWTEDEARAIRDGLSAWLVARPTGR